MTKNSALAAVVLTAALLGSAACGTAETPTAAQSCSTLDPAQPWYGDNRERIGQFISENGRCGTTDSVSAPLALFDWDNTVVKNDVGELISVVDESETTAGEPAFANYDHRLTNPGYALVVQLMRGYTEAQIADFARAARKQNLDATEGSEQTIGTTEVDGYVRYYSQIQNLIAVLRDNGFDVRIISASAEPVVRVWAEELDIPGDRVMGVPLLADNGVYTGHIPGCGGKDLDQVITYIDGKRCRVNEQVFGVEGAAAFQQLPAARRAAFAAGDSDTDVVFLGDATGLRLVVNRNKTELMCNAYGADDGTWVINPMFIDPKPRRSEPYPCASAGFTAADGTGVPLRRPDGTTVPDQQDRVFR
ncbi:haloacid dehalogenase-like hydrolase [Nocardia asteroides]